MKLAKYIYDLLLENETVIIPGFGAFVSTYKPAVISETEIKPPSKEISFTRQIKNNDGVLVTAIARKAKISQPNALKRIERERENILYQLDKGEKVSVENVGVLFYNEKNEISFTPFQKDNLLLDSFGFQPVSMDDFIEESIELETVETVSEPEQVDASVKNHVETGIETTITEPAIKEFNEPVFGQQEKPIKLPEYKHEPFTVYPEKRKPSGWYWLLLILIPIFIGGYFILNKFSKSSHKEVYLESLPITKKQEIIVQTITPADSLNDSIVDNEAVETVKIETTVNTISADTKYYIVGGGFKKEENAEKFIVRLKERGIEGFMLGQKGSLFLVGIASFNTSNEAYNSLNEHVKKHPDWNLWVYEK